MNIRKYFVNQYNLVNILNFYFLLSWRNFIKIENKNHQCYFICIFIHHFIFDILNLLEHSFSLFDLHLK